jgi:hypothetical protein
MKWSDIEFKEHHSAKDGVMAKVEFPNGEWCSIVGAPPEYDEKTGSNWNRLYGDGVETFEIYSSSTKKTRGMVKGWLTKKQVMSHLRYLKNKSV